MKLPPPRTSGSGLALYVAGVLLGVGASVVVAWCGDGGDRFASERFVATVVVAAQARPSR